MTGRTHLATLAGTAPGQRLEVALVTRRDGRVAIDLREQHYADGIGWFDQRTLELDPRQLRQLQAVLGEPSLRMAERAEEPREILPFPGPAAAESRRPAMGD